MKKKLSIVIAVTLILALVMGTVSSFAATTNQQRLNSINQQLSSAKNKLSQSKKQESSLTNKINTLDVQINVTQNDIEKTVAEIQETKNKIAVKKQELDVKSQEIVKQNDDLGERLCAMYKNGEVSYIEIILGSGSFSELLTNIDMVTRIYQKDEDFMDLLQEQYDAIAQTKRELETLNMELDQKEAQLKSQQSALKSDKAQAQAVRAEVQQDIQAQNDLIDDLNEAAEQITTLIQEEQRKAAEAAAAAAAAAKANSGTSGSSSSSGTTAAASTQFVGGTFTLPAPSYTRISSYYGYRIHPITGTRKLHTGVDFAAASGSKCVAAGAGTVIYAGWYSGYGNTVIIDHGGGISTLYAHNSSLTVSKGTKVSKGQQIAKIGSTGNSTGPHCHFEVRVNGKHTNPMSYLGG